MSYENVGSNFAILPSSPFGPGGAGGRYAGLGDGSNSKYSASGLGYLGAQQSVSEVEKAKAVALVAPALASVQAAVVALQQAQSQLPTTDFSAVQSQIASVQQAIQGVASQIQGFAVTPFNPNVSPQMGQQLTQQQQAEAAALQGLESQISQAAGAASGLVGAVSTARAQALAQQQAAASTLASQQATTAAQVQAQQDNATVDSALLQARSFVGSQNWPGALAALQSQSVVQAAIRVNRSSDLQAAIDAVNGQQAQSATNTQNAAAAKQAADFARAQALAQQSCQQQPGMTWAPGDMVNMVPGTCSQSQQYLQSQTRCQTAGGVWDGQSCDMSQVNAAAAAKASSDAAAAAAAQQANQLAMQQAQEQFQLQQASQQAQAQQATAQAQANAQAMSACAQQGGTWGMSAGLVDAAGNPIPSCDMSAIQAAKAQQQQLSTYASLAQAFGPILAANPDLARGVVGNIFGIAAGQGGMATSVPGGAGGGGGGPAQLAPTQGAYQDWSSSGVSESF